MRGRYILRWDFLWISVCSCRSIHSSCNLYASSTTKICGSSLRSFRKGSKEIESWTFQWYCYWSYGVYHWWNFFGDSCTTTWIISLWVILGLAVLAMWPSLSSIGSSDVICIGKNLLNQIYKSSWFLYGIVSILLLRCLSFYFSIVQSRKEQIFLMLLECSIVDLRCLVDWNLHGWFIFFVGNMLLDMRLSY